jgi:hypothetical protein
VHLDSSQSLTLQEDKCNRLAERLSIAEECLLLARSEAAEASQSALAVKKAHVELAQAMQSRSQAEALAATLRAEVGNLHVLTQDTVCRMESLELQLQQDRAAHKETVLKIVRAEQRASQAAAVPAWMQASPVDRSTMVPFCSLPAATDSQLVDCTRPESLEGGSKHRKSHSSRYAPDNKSIDDHNAGDQLPENVTLDYTQPGTSSPGCYATERQETQKEAVDATQQVHDSRAFACSAPAEHLRSPSQVPVPGTRGVPTCAEACTQPPAAAGFGNHARVAAGRLRAHATRENQQGGLAAVDEVTCKGATEVSVSSGSGSSPEMAFLARDVAMSLLQVHHKANTHQVSIVPLESQSLVASKCSWELDRLNL